MKEHELMMGSDPEIMVEHGNGTLFPAFEFMPLNDKPLRTKEGENYYADGFQAETTVIPSTSIKKVLESIKRGYNGIITAARKKDSGAHFSAKTVVPTPLEMLKGLPEQFVVFGCAPSYSVYGLTGQAMDGHTTPYRFAGGHIHLGVGEQSEDMVYNIVNALDSLLAVACVSLFENIDNPVRRVSYGLAGEHRLPPHGIEYRSLSCGWTYHPDLAANILDIARKIVMFALNGGDHRMNRDEVIECVNRCDVRRARDLMARHWDLFKQLGFEGKINFMKPVEESFPSIDKIEQNWGL